MLSQIAQKQMKNQFRLPRTAGMRTLTELTGSLTKAGLDPSRIQERAEILAKIQGEARRKRKREEREEAGGMEVDGDGDGDGANADKGGEGEWMDVDDEEGSPGKRAKSNSGTVVAKDARRLPKTDRQATGLWDKEVRIHLFFAYRRLTPCELKSSKYQRLPNYGALHNASGIGRRRRVMQIVPSQPKWCVLLVPPSTGILINYAAKTQ